MRVRSASPFWPLKDGLPFSCMPLKEDRTCDVAVVGGGLCGSMIAYHLAEAGADTVVLDKRRIGLGSTSASTALVLYEVDMHLSDLISMRGEKSAVRAYKLGLEAIHKIERLAKKVGGCGFVRKNSLYLASTVADRSRLETEYKTRRRYGFSLDYLDASGVLRKFGLKRPAALLGHVAGQIDPYLFAYSLLAERMGRGVAAYDLTEVVEYQATKRGVLLTTDRGSQVKARKVVFATGYETKQKEARKAVDLKSSYAIVTEPVPELLAESRDIPVIWETARPYFYARTTRDGRIMAGGEDEDFVNPTRRDHLIPSKASTLLNRTKRTFPDLDVETGYAWAGTFGETEDSLPYIGEIEGYPNAYFALCYGANGTNFALMASEIIRDMYLKRPNEDAEIFRFGR